VSKRSTTRGAIRSFTAGGTRSGPSRFSRNPIYVAFALIHLGVAAAFGSWWLLVTLAVSMGVIATRYRAARGALSGSTIRIALPRLQVIRTKVAVVEASERSPDEARQVHIHIDRLLCRLSQGCRPSLTLFEVPAVFEPVSRGRTDQPRSKITLSGIGRQLLSICMPVVRFRTACTRDRVSIGLARCN
jgi:hypothetical protein